MTASYILKVLFFPPNGLILFFLLCWLIGKKLPSLASLFFLIGLVFFYIFSLPVTVELFARQLETEPALTPESWSQLNKKADVIVILGGGRESRDEAWDSEQPSLLSMQRIRYAARIARTSELPILTSGGLHFNRPPSEAQLAANVLAKDFALDTHWVEGLSRTTMENAERSATILHEVGIRKIVLVTNAWHMPRARWSFEQAGFEVVPAPVGFWSVAHQRPYFGLLPESRAFWQNSLLLNEWLGMHVYRSQAGN